MNQFKIKCKECDGSGEFWDKHIFNPNYDNTCPTCQGSGQVDKTIDFIKWLISYAEGFDLESDGITDEYTLTRPDGDFFDYPDGDFFDYYDRNLHEIITDYPLLLHRAKEGWNKANNKDYRRQIMCERGYIRAMILKDAYYFEDYPQHPTLTQGEQALLDCLWNIYKEIEIK
jgi:hypothetical protein